MSPSKEFYTDVFVGRGNKIYYRGYDDNGIRVQDKINFEPTLFIDTKNETEWKTLWGNPVKPIKFDSINAARDYIKSYSGIEGFNIHGMERWHTQFLHDKFKTDPVFDLDRICIGIYDIETRPGDDGYSPVNVADGAISEICVVKKFRGSVTTVVFGLNPVGTGELVVEGYEEYKVSRYEFRDERDMLKSFLAYWKGSDFDVVSGWNTNGFDIVYIYHRLIKLFNEDFANGLSPWGQCRYGSKVNDDGMEEHWVTVSGLAQLDYMQLFDKYGGKFGTLENMKLDTVAEVVLKEKKLDYAEYGSLVRFERMNPRKFVEYNVRDCLLILRMDDKLKYITMAIRSAMMARIPYADILKTVPEWDSLIYGRALSKKMCVPLMKDMDRGKFPGGYVKNPITGKWEWVVVVDATSLYPSNIIQGNLSPETIVGYYDGFVSAESLWDTPSGHIATHPDCSISANGYLFLRPEVKRGIIPEMIEEFFDGRVTVKAKMLDLEAELELVKQEIERRKAK